MFSFTEDTVLDPFMGTGTTLRAALRCNRNGIGNEIDPEYFQMACANLRQENAQGKLGLDPAMLIFQSK